MVLWQVTVGVRAEDWEKARALLDPKVSQKLPITNYHTALPVVLISSLLSLSMVMTGASGGAYL